MLLGVPVISVSDAQGVLGGARENLKMTSGKLTQVEVNIKSGNESQIKEAVTIIQEAARDDLNDVYNKFITYSQKSHSLKNGKCLIL